LKPSSITSARTPVEIPMPRVLPSEFEAIHKLSFDWHDALADYVVRGEEAGLLLVKTKSRRDGDSDTMEGLEGEALCDWMEQNGYADAVDEGFTRHIALALLSDFCHFLYESLRCSEKGKLAVAYALLRKPLRDNLFYIEWLLADREEFIRLFREGGNSVDVAKLTPERRLSVLVAADREQDAEVLALTLEAVGCVVVTTTVGAETVDLAFLGQPDAVVLVPTRPGWEGVPAAIAERAAWRKPLVVTLTAGAGVGVPGVHAALQRPVSPELLAGLVRRFREFLAGLDGFDPAI
jgi:CheY-like chemotaxis protein